MKRARALASASSLMSATPTVLQAHVSSFLSCRDHFALAASSRTLRSVSQQLVASQPREVTVRRRGSLDRSDWPKSMLRLRGVCTLLVRGLLSRELGEVTPTLLRSLATSPIGSALLALDVCLVSPVPRLLATSSSRSYHNQDEGEKDDEGHWSFPALTTLRLQPGSEWQCERGVLKRPGRAARFPALTELVHDGVDDRGLAGTMLLLCAGDDSRLRRLHLSRAYVLGSTYACLSSLTCLTDLDLTDAGINLGIDLGIVSGDVGPLRLDVLPRSLRRLHMPHHARFTDLPELPCLTRLHAPRMKIATLALEFASELTICAPVLEQLDLGAVLHVTVDHVWRLLRVHGACDGRVLGCLSHLRAVRLAPADRVASAARWCDVDRIRASGLQQTQLRPTMRVQASHMEHWLAPFGLITDK